MKHLIVFEHLFVFNNVWVYCYTSTYLSTNQIKVNNVLFDCVFLSLFCFVNQKTAVSDNLLPL